ncbi:alpha/beta hydrolase [Streptomyces cinnabarinus]|uniref:Alpha/beta hydrolase n=1 Tax=Streptomyces cinnabarinus TaxID=67287 RepID=A0ABY7KR00_9ACTN|nr:alpha/beta fold hydrolase [Streptomyces cinnabarinus]WAZ26015.1 alpha/beta hydrolase [Streptomyces cinnabarinus]
MRFVFVHGTGVRRERFDELFRQVEAGLLMRFPEAEVEPCYWGTEFGATLHAGGASVPGLRPLAAADVEDDPETAEWLLLLTDPLCELRVLAELGGGSGEDDEDDGAEVFRLPGLRSAGEAVRDCLGELPRDLDPGDELAVLLRETGLADGYRYALDTVADSDEFHDAVLAAEDDATAAELVRLTGRAVVAVLLSEARDTTLCTGDERDKLVDVLGDRLGGIGRGVLTRTAGVLFKLAQRLTPQSVLDGKRGEVTSDKASEIGDILRYQARGEHLRAHLEKVIGRSPEPPVLIGHSLGGIALVDTLALAARRQPPLPVRLLVTVGSQAPFLHELGALAGLEPGAALPSGFPPWLNIYDRRDLLSYLAEPVFPDDARVTDHEVRSRQPFPLSHSAYWRLQPVFERIAQALR